MLLIKSKVRPPIMLLDTRPRDQIGWCDIPAFAARGPPTCRYRGAKTPILPLVLPPCRFHLKHPFVDALVVAANFPLQSGLEVTALTDSRQRMFWRSATPHSSALLRRLPLEKSENKSLNMLLCLSFVDGSNTPTDWTPYYLIVGGASLAWRCAGTCHSD